MSWLLTLLWGAAVGFDATSFPQAMISRPFVAGTVAGLLLGVPTAGAVLGVVLEIFAVSALPFGAVRTPEPGTAAVAGTLAYATAAVTSAGIVPPLLLCAFVFALVWERIGGWSVHMLRRVNERIVSLDTRPIPITAGRIERSHILAMLLDFVRAGLVTGVGALLGTLVLRLAGPPWPFAPDVVMAVLGVAAATVLGSALSVFGGFREHRVAFGIGVGSGILALFILP